MWNLKNLKKKIDSKFKDFIYRNSRFRFLKSYLNVVILPYFTKFIVLGFILLFLSFLGLKFFKPEILTKIYNKGHQYFYSNLKLDSYRFSSIKISGIERSNKDKILNIIKKTKKNFKNSHNNSLLSDISKNIKKNQKWVESVSVFRSLPNRLNIVINEYIPFAIWHDSNKIYIVDRSGNKVLINNDDDFEHLIVLSGKNAYLNVRALFNILAISPEISSKVYSANWIGSRRWNIRFEDGLLVKLPENDIEKAWQNLINIYNNEGSLYNLKIIDLRIDNKTYLEYKKD